MASDRKTPNVKHYKTITSTSGRHGYLKETSLSSILPVARAEAGDDNSSLKPTVDKPSIGDWLPILLGIVLRSSVRDGDNLLVRMRGETH